MYDNIFETMEGLMRGIEQFGTALAILTLLLMLVTGLAECFFGYRIMRISFAVAGFFLGFSLGALLLGLVLDQDAQTIWILLSIVCGIVGGYLLFRMYLVGIFLNNGLLATLVFLLLMGDIYGSSFPIALIGGIVVGVLSVKFVRPWVIATTGISGALTAGLATAGLLSLDSGLAALIFALIFAVLGIRYQWKTTDRNYRKSGRATKIHAGPVSTAVPSTTPRMASAMSAPVHHLNEDSKS